VYELPLLFQYAAHLSTFPQHKEGTLRIRKHIESGSVGIRAGAVSFGLR
jgi:hypothetical protein